jgi:hypothetical protein
MPMTAGHGNPHLMLMRFAQKQPAHHGNCCRNGRYGHSRLDRAGHVYTP